MILKGFPSIVSRRGGESARAGARLGDLHRSEAGFTVPEQIVDEIDAESAGAVVSNVPQGQASLARNGERNLFARAGEYVPPLLIGILST